MIPPACKTIYEYSNLEDMQVYHQITYERRTDIVYMWRHDIFEGGFRKGVLQSPIYGQNTEKTEFFFQNFALDVFFWP